MTIDISQKYYQSLFKPKKIILQDISLSFPVGETTLIIGTSGAGKSTLIKCLIGETTFEGTIEGYDKRDIAYIPQHPALNMELTAYDTVEWALKFARLEGQGYNDRAETYIKDTGLTLVKDHKCKNLSGGQMQRVSIAKELARNKKIIIADEIDTGLDCGVAKSIVEILNRLTRERQLTTIVISHNLINVELYDNIIVLVKNSKGIGQVAFAGKPRDAKRHFGVNEYVDILTKVNSADEGGAGLADKYIDKFFYSEM